jgi:hypothetical protein
MLPSDEVLTVLTIPADGLGCILLLRHIDWRRSIDGRIYAKRWEGSATISARVAKPMCCV